MLQMQAAALARSCGSVFNAVLRPGSQIR
jgi:hypothetical protein